MGVYRRFFLYVIYVILIALIKKAIIEVELLIRFIKKAVFVFDLLGLFDMLERLFTETLNG